MLHHHDLTLSIIWLLNARQIADLTLTLSLKIIVQCISMRTPNLLITSILVIV